MSISFETHEDIMKQWDAWRSYIAKGGGGSWPRDAFESLLDYLEEEKVEAVQVAFEDGYKQGVGDAENALIEFKNQLEGGII